MRELKVGTLIIGAGQAGASAAFALREKGYSDPVCIIGEEALPPYERPPLSKAVLREEKSLSDILVRDLPAYDSHNIQLMLGSRAEQILPQEQQVKLGDGQVISYDNLILATGGRPRQLPGKALPGVHYLRSHGDGTRLAAELKQYKKLAVIGGGFIGLEVAASARKMGLEVCVIEAAPRVLQRSLPETIAADVVALHEDQGVEFHYNARLQGFAGTDRLSGIQLEDKSIDADIAVVGIGLIPNTELAETAGLAVDNGICTDAQCRTGNAHIYAIGDCANSYHTYYQRAVRLESWQNANLQGAIVAAAICAETSDIQNDAVPWLWSDQYDWSFQVAGIFDSQAQLISRGSAAEGKQIWFIHSDGVLTGVVGWGKGTSIAKDVRVGQMLLQQGKTPPFDMLADENISLKKLLKL
ncbi:NAD(P)/FAD-dependent oxidoreductase [Aliamphritea hakodatensis]|uniref:NAD(P)/FAD-dependent oxidoreductase n=1 Tax=Aliamphritea hakodatensis TaxID=2895352 RepID=UPI0022FD9164|nr:FAD-dependent oxidoreductase [Aliamphritea hakodatensis]